MRQCADYDGVELRLTDERLDHIERRPEMEGQLDRIEETLPSSPIVSKAGSRSTGELLGVDRSVVANTRDDILLFVFHLPDEFRIVEDERECSVNVCDGDVVVVARDRFGRGTVLTLPVKYSGSSPEALCLLSL